ncbi:MAG: efflux RND transporter permease subunit, partial [Thermoguttaceae bacterium]|nr:efflux RND transporter permease subunit [Thermoguttaceae bacterium]
ILRRVDRKPAIKVQCNARGIPASVLRKRLEEALQTADLKLPPGCEMTWHGEFEEVSKGTKPIIRTFPLCVLGMFLICVGMFNRLLQPVLIFLTAPLSLIGGVLGLWFTGHSFEFLCIPGFLGLSGILIRNAIILVGETDRTRGQNAGKCAPDPEKTDRDALIEAAVSRFRPVTLASGTTILGILPLLNDAFYGALSAVLVGGLLVATLLTLVILPVFYSLAHGIHEKR